MSSSSTTKKKKARPVFRGLFKSKNSQSTSIRPDDAPTSMPRPSTATPKKAKRRFRDLFNPRGSRSPSISGSDDEQDETNTLLTPSHAPIAGQDPSFPLIGQDVKVSSSSNVQRHEEDWHDAAASTTPRLDIRSRLGIAARFSQTLLKKFPDCVDNNPVKMALSIVKTIIEIKDEIGDAKDALAEGLQSTRSLLSDAIGNLELDDTEDVKKEIEDYKRNIGEQNTQLVQITQELDSVLRHLDYENYKQKITTICKNINDITNKFMLNMQIQIRKTTAKMHEQMKKQQQMSSLQGLNPSRKADHKTVLEGQSLKRETCAEGTRVQILQDITDWAKDDAEDSPHVFWLTGQAGSGKTTIANTIAKLFDQGQEESAILGSNFLCSRQFEETRTVSRIMPTLAYQLAGKCPSYQAALHDHIEDMAAVVNYDISEQMEELLVQPWNTAQKLESSPTYLIVIDALDEINEDGGSRFLAALLTIINRYHLHNLKFLVTSRTDPQIVRLCDTFNSQTVCRLQDVPIEQAEADVGKYLHIRLPELVGSPEMAELEKQANGLFIYAATAVRILTASRSMTHKEQSRRLSSLLTKTSSLSTVGKDKSPIDGLYAQILSDAFSDFADEEYFVPRLRILFTYLCSAERISPWVAATLMDDDEELARSVLDNLHSVLYIQEDRVFWYHASFPDFMMEQKRSNFSLNNTQFNFWRNQADHHFLLASSCFRIMASKPSGLKFNIGGITSSYLLDSECADEISTNVKKNISPALRYACIHWGHHLSSSPSSHIDRISGNISVFLQIHVLFWIEAMHLLKAHNRCVSNLHQARGWVSKANLPSATQVLLVENLLESANFATYFLSSPAAESTPYLYISSLATWKSGSILTKNWRNQFSSFPRFIYGDAADDVPLLTVDLKSAVFSVAFSKDGTRFVAGLKDNTVQTIDASTGQVLKILTGHTHQVRSVSFSNDDKWIASGSDDRTIRLWDTSTGACLKVLEGHEHLVMSVAISPNDKLIASGSWDKSIYLWDVSTGNCLKVLTGHIGAVYSVSFSPDNTRIVSGSGDKSVRIWDVSSGQELVAIKGHVLDVNSVAYTNDGTRVVSASDDDSIRVWDASTGIKLAAFNGHSSIVTSVVVCYSAYMLSGSADESVRIWDMTTGHTLKVLKGHVGYVHSVGYSSDPTMVVSGSEDGFVRVWNLVDVLNKPDVDGVEANTSASVTSVAISSDGHRIIFGTYNGSVHIWDILTHQELRVFRHTTEHVTAVAVSSSGSRFGWATGKEVWVWEASKQAPVMAHRFNHDPRIGFVRFSKEDRLLALGDVESDDELGDERGGSDETSDGSDETLDQPTGLVQNVEMWDESTGVQSWRFKLGYDGDIESLSLSQDGQLIVTGLRDGSLKVWEVSSARNLNVMRGHTGHVSSVAFSDDASRIVSGSYDKTVRVWDALTGSELKVLRGHDDWVESVAFANNDTRVVSGSRDCTMRVWDVHTGEELSNLRGRHTQAVKSIAVESGNSRFVISGSKDGSVIIWDLEAPSWYLADTNWILSSPTNSRLMWVPPSAQVVKRPNCRILVGGYSTVDFERAMQAIGPTWENCYTPNTLSVT